MLIVLEISPLSYLVQVFARYSSCDLSLIERERISEGIYFWVHCCRGVMTRSLFLILKVDFNMRKWSLIWEFWKKLIFVESQTWQVEVAQSNICRWDWESQRAFTTSMIRQKIGKQTKTPITEMIKSLDHHRKFKLRLHPDKNKSYKHMRSVEQRLPPSVTFSDSTLIDISTENLSLTLLQMFFEMQLLLRLASSVDCIEMSRWEWRTPDFSLLVSN